MRQAPDRRRQPSGGDDFVRLLQTCSAVANEALDRSEEFEQKTREQLREVAAKVHLVEEPESLSRAARELLDDLENHLGEVRRVLEETIATLEQDLASRFRDLRADANYVTVTVFGRTKAGKSTLLESLTQGDGSSIGRGAQHTTTDIREYFWPKNQRGLRLVDTPGVEGLHGEALATKACQFVERSDHILFVLTDDAATAGELDYFKYIQTAGKSVSVLLNVKFDDTELLLTCPAFVFRDDELDGHRRRIVGFLRDQIAEDDIVLLPFHARSAFLATVETDPQRARQLEAASRVPAIKQRIRDFVERDAIAARLSSPRHVLLRIVTNAGDVLDERVPALEELDGRIEEQAQRTAATLNALKGAARTAKSGALRTVAAVDAQIPRIVDELIQERCGGTELERRYRATLKKCGVLDAEQRCRATVERELTETLQEQIAASVTDAKLMPNLRGAERALERFAKARAGDESRGRFKRKATRVGSAVVSGALGVAVWMWWNPVGWTAAAVAAGAAVVGFTTDHVVKRQNEKWRAADERKLANERERIIDALLASNAELRAGMKTSLDAWERAFFKAAREDLLGSLAHAQRTVKQTRAHLCESVASLLQLVVQIDEDLVRQAVALVVPEVREGIVHILGVQREPGYGTKIRVRSKRGPGAAIGFCLGKGGARVRALRTALGGEPVSFIDADADLAEQVVAALYPARVRREDVALPKLRISPMAITHLARWRSLRSCMPIGAKRRMGSGLWVSHLFESSFRREGPFSTMRWARLSTRSQMASASVGSAR